MGEARVCRAVVATPVGQSSSGGTVHVKIHGARKETLKNFGPEPFWGIMPSRLALAWNLALLSGTLHNWDHPELKRDVHSTLTVQSGKVLGCRGWASSAHPGTTYFFHGAQLRLFQGCFCAALTRELD